MEYVYHLKPVDMHGKILMPLSVMEEKYPKLYKEKIKLYKNREKLLDKKINILDCKWKDVLFFSTINPAIIFTALEMVGLLDEDIPDILKFPISLFDDNVCLYKETDNSEKFTRIKKYKEDKFLPTETIEYFLDCAKSKKDPLIFSNITHLCYKGDVDIRKASVIKYERLI